MGKNTAQKIQIVKEEAEKEAQKDGRSSVQDQTDRIKERIQTEVKK